MAKKLKIKDNMPRVITVMGVDGSGKSTQARSVIESLEARGGKVFYFHALQFSIANKGKNSIVTPGDQKPVTSASWYKIQLRKVAFMIDCIRFEILLTRLARDAYTHVVSDRYFYDYLVNIAYLSRSRSLYSFGVSLLGSLVHVPSHAFYLDVSSQTILSRERDVEQDAPYLEKKIDLYKKYATLWGITNIDGERSRDVVHQDIFDAMETPVSVVCEDPQRKSFGQT